jgi:ABC-type bacteriocin/lantibiotic exporter with double-glycine peptidase domain
MPHVIPHRQSPSFCGPSSLKMVLGHYGVEATEAELGRLAGTAPEKGTPAKGIAEAARAFGFDAEIRDGCTVEDLREAVVTREIPAIIDWFSGTCGHYSVCIDVTESEIVHADPTTGEIERMDIETFKGVWFDFSSPYPTDRSAFILQRMILVRPRAS